MTKRKTALPQYLTTNQAGTYVFQARIPKHICQNNPTIKPTIWRSLGTKDRGEALRLSRWIWLMFDELSNRFNDSEVFGKAMELLREYDTKAVGDYLTKVEPFLVSLGDEDSELLERVLGYRSEIQKQRNVDASVVTTEDIRKLIREEVAHGKSNEPDFSIDNYLLSEMVDKYMANQIDEGLASGSRKPYQSKLNLFNSTLVVVH